MESTKRVLALQAAVWWNLQPGLPYLCNDSSLHLSFSNNSKAIAVTTHQANQSQFICTRTLVSETWVIAKKFVLDLSTARYGMLKPHGRLRQDRAQSEEFRCQSECCIAVYDFCNRSGELRSRSLPLLFEFSFCS